MSERLLKLERRIAELEAQLRRPVGGSMPYVNTRPAKAVAGPSAYPGSGNTFYIQFLDGSYSRATGNQTPTYVGRRAITSTLCHNIRNTLPPENTILEVFEWKGYWWTDFESSTSQKPRFQQFFGQNAMWVNGDSSSTAPNGTSPYMAIGPEWAPNFSSSSSMSSDTIFTFDNTYAGVWPTGGGQLICQIPGTYMIFADLFVQLDPESGVTPDAMDYAVVTSGISTDAGAGSTGNFGWVTAHTFPNQAATPPSVTVKFLARSTVGPLEVNDRVKIWYSLSHAPDDVDWHIKPQGFRCHVVEIKENTNTAVRVG